MFKSITRKRMHKSIWQSNNVYSYLLSIQAWNRVWMSSYLQKTYVMNPSTNGDDDQRMWMSNNCKKVAVTILQELVVAVTAWEESLVVSSTWTVDLNHKGLTESVDLHTFFALFWLLLLLYYLIYCLHRNKQSLCSKTRLKLRRS